MKKKNVGQLQYSDRETVTPAVCLEFWERELDSFLNKRDTMIVYEKIDVEDYIRSMIAKHQSK